MVVGIGLSSLFGFHQPAPQQNVGATVPIVVAVFQTSLQASITASATSMTLVSGTDKAGNSLSGYQCFNIDEGTAVEEFVCGTVSGTAVSSMLRGIDPVDGDLEVTALKKAHRRGASVKITNYPSLAIVSRIINGTETIPNAIKYASGVAPSTADDLTDKAYVDAVAVAGAPDASTTVKGIGEEATLAEIDAATAAGGTAARLFINPSTLQTSIYGTRLPTANEKIGITGNNLDIAVGSGNKLVTQTGLQHGAEQYAADAGANDTYVITLSPVPTSYTTGMVVRFKANTVNTGAATLNVNSLGAKTIVKGVNTTLADGDIAASSLNTVIYDGTNFVLQNPVNNIATTYVSSISTVSATTTVNTDTTITTGFVPKTITIYYNLQGVSAGSSKNSQGVAIYNSVGTLVVNQGLYTNRAAGATITTSIATFDATAPYAGDNSGTYNIVTLSIPSVSATGFVLRSGFVQNGNPSASSSIVVVATQ